MESNVTHKIIIGDGMRTACNKIVTLDFTKERPNYNVEYSIHWDNVNCDICLNKLKDGK